MADPPRIHNVGAVLGIYQQEATHEVLPILWSQEFERVRMKGSSTIEEGHLAKDLSR